MTAPDANLYTLLRSRFPENLDATAIETGAGLYYTWRDLERASGRMANWMAREGIAPGARVAVQVEKSPEVLMLYLACLRAGLVYVPLNTAYQRGELEHFLHDAQPALVVCDPAREAEIAPLARAAGAHLATLGESREGSLLRLAAPEPEVFPTVLRRPDDLAAILYTSGTTGRSKGAMLSHRNLAANALALDEAWGFSAERAAGRRDVLLHALPIFHVHGLFVATHAAWLAGARMIFLPRFEVGAVLARLREATVFMGVPTHYTRLLAERGLDAAACAGVRLFVSGSAPLLAETFREFAARTGHTIVERYGMSETVMLVSNPYFGPDGARVPGTVGRPLPGVQVRVVTEDGAPCASGEIGQVQVRGANVFAGYWRMPDKTAEEFTPDGWFRTGDVGRFGGEGAPEDYLSLVGRSKDLIITGGLNVYPKEIEGWIDEMPGVVESAVIGLPHPDFGEAVAAVVVARRAGAIDSARLVAALKERIAGFKVPKRVFVVEDLPRNAMGKVQKNVLRERYKNTFTPPAR